MRNVGIKIRYAHYQLQLGYFVTSSFLVCDLHSRFHAKCDVSNSVKWKHLRRALGTNPIVFFDHGVGILRTSKLPLQIAVQNL